MKNNTIRGKVSNTKNSRQETRRFSFWESLLFSLFETCVKRCLQCLRRQACFLLGLRTSAPRPLVLDIAQRWTTQYPASVGVFHFDFRIEMSLCYCNQFMSKNKNGKYLYYSVHHMGSNFSTRKSGTRQQSHTEHNIPSRRQRRAKLFSRKLQS